MLHGIVVAVVVKGVSDANLGSIDLFRTAVDPVSDDHLFNSFQGCQIEPPPRVSLCMGVGAGIIIIIICTISTVVKCG